MEYFAGLDVSMAETQVCVMGRNGAVIHKAKVPFGLPDPVDVWWGLKAGKDVYSVKPLT